jgi:arylsulfatase A-like enzyme
MAFTQSRRNFMKSMGALAATGLAYQSQAQPSRPNIIFLLTDDQRWDALGCMGNPMIQTPNIDRLAQEGTLFTEHFCTTSICMSSRATIFTGQYASTHQIHDFRTPLSEEQFANSYPILLRKAGYKTGFIGKYGIGPVPKDKFDYFKGFPGQGWYFSKDKEETRHLTTIMKDQAMEFLDQQSGSDPFCLSISFKSPHCQDGDPEQFLYDPRYKDIYQDDTFTPAETATEEEFQKLPEFLQNSEARIRWKLRFENPELYQKSVKGYYRLIYGVDQTVGDIFKKLEEKGMRENTVIIFTSDNGFYLGEHGLAGKWFIHEESIRLPLIISDPRRKNKNRKCDKMTLTTDMAPTILDIAGIKPPVSMQGTSLLPALEEDPQNWRKEFFYEHLFEHNTIPKSEGVRTQRYKYVRYLGKDHEELYDIKNDPLEQHNLAKQRVKKTNELRTKCDTWRKKLDTWNPAKAQPWVDPQT